jgi:hypothetical protein
MVHVYYKNITSNAYYSYIIIVMLVFLKHVEKFYKIVKHR